MSNALFARIETRKGSIMAEFMKQLDLTDLVDGGSQEELDGAKLIVGVIVTGDLEKVRPILLASVQDEGTRTVLEQGWPHVTSLLQAIRALLAPGFHQAEAAAWRVARAEIQLEELGKHNMPDESGAVEDATASARVQLEIAKLELQAASKLPALAQILRSAIALTKLDQAREIAMKLASVLKPGPTEAQMTETFVKQVDGGQSRAAQATLRLIKARFGDAGATRALDALPPSVRAFLAGVVQPTKPA